LNRTPHLEIHAAGLHESEVRDLPVGGKALLVGRSPEPPRAVDVPPDATPVVIRSQSVSSNHLLAWRTAEASFLRDLGSRNGTWLRLPPGADVRVDPSVTGLRVQLAATPAAASGAVNEPAEAEWTDRADYARTVAAAVTRWSELQGLSLVVALVGPRAAPEPAGHAGLLPLADGTTLEVSAGRTLDDSSHTMFKGLWRYVTRQNALFAAEGTRAPTGWSWRRPPSARPTGRCTRPPPAAPAPSCSSVRPARARRGWPAASTATRAAAARSSPATAPCSPRT